VVAAGGGQRGRGHLACRHAGAGASPGQAPDPPTHSASPPCPPLQVLFLSFSTIIGIMIGTFFIVVNTGAVRLAGIE
jgi:hypothetical protein